MRENDYTLRARVLLRSMGMPPNCKGYRYLTCAVALTAETLDREGRLPDGLYRRVGVCCAAGPETVERRGKTDRLSPFLSASWPRCCCRSGGILDKMDRWHIFSSCSPCKTGKNRIK